VAAAFIFCFYRASAQQADQSKALQVLTPQTNEQTVKRMHV